MGGDEHPGVGDLPQHGVDPGSVLSAGDGVDPNEDGVHGQQTLANVRGGLIGVADGLGAEPGAGEGPVDCVEALVRRDISRENGDDRGAVVSGGMRLRVAHEIGSARGD